MASKCRQALAAALPLAMLASTANAQGARWTLTQYLVPVSETVEVLTGSYYPGGTSLNTVTIRKTVNPTITPTYTAPLAISTRTAADSDIDTVMIYLNPADVATDDFFTYTEEYPYRVNLNLQTLYVQPIEWTAPASCPTPFTATYTSTLSIPSQVTHQLPEMTSVETHTNTQSEGSYEGEVFTVVTAHLPSNAVPLPANDIEHLNTVYGPIVSRCYNPFEYYPWTDRRYPSSDENTGSDLDSVSSFWSRCSATNSRCKDLLIIAIVLVVSIPVIFLLGFFESYFWFRRMMIGKGALRFGTICWTLLFLPIVCFCRYVPSRDAATQEYLHKKWAQVPFGKALKLWLQNGFRYRYPVRLLGEHPNYHNQGPAVVAQ